MIDLEFPRPKDPADVAWYLLRSAEPIGSLVGVTATATGVADEGATGFATPGDTIAASTLAISSAQVTTQPTAVLGGATVAAGYGIVFQLSGGAPGTAYAIRAGYVTSTGSTLYRTAILSVAGQ